MTYLPNGLEEAGDDELRGMAQVKNRKSGHTHASVVPDGVILPDSTLLIGIALLNTQCALS